MYSGRGIDTATLAAFAMACNLYLWTQRITKSRHQQETPSVLLTAYDIRMIRMPVSVLKRILY